MEPLHVPGTLDSLQCIAAYVGKAAEAAGLDRRAAYRLRLAVDELATNAIVHGYQESGTEGDVTITASVDDDTLTVSIEDTGPAFDPTVSGPAEPVGWGMPLEDRPMGGLGLFLVHGSVNTLRYERDGDRNRSILLVRRASTLDHA